MAVQTRCPSPIHPQMDRQPPREKMLPGQPQQAWQSYSPPPAENHDGYAYQQPAAPGYGQAAARPAQGYQAPSYTVQDQPYQDQGYPGETAQFPGPAGPAGQPSQVG